VTARLKVDEDLPCEIADLLSAHGHVAATVAAQGWTGMADIILWQRVQNEGRWLVTADKGFADLRRFPPGSHAGVIPLRAQQESRRA
jgi:predicted nuclease of predicted toxin-antitoxin system